MKEEEEEVRMETESESYSSGRRKKRSYGRTMSPLYLYVLGSRILLSVAKQH